jgi:GDP-4-dehydro-6-deoxy-D-mannose reductase
VTQPRRFLVTGGSGFVGTHLVRLLARQGHEVACVQTGPGNGLPPGVRSYAMDLCDRRNLEALPRRWDSVIHLAGPSIPGQYADAQPMVRSVAMTLNLLDHLEAAKVLLVSSCHVYAPSLAMRAEDSPVLPQGRYGLSKHLVEQMAGHYGRTLDIRIARPFNHVGPGQRPELVLPSLLRRLREAGAGRAGAGQGELTMRGSDSIRDFVDVRDVAAAYLAILDLDQPRDRCFNVCSGRGLRISEVAALAMELAGRPMDLRFEDRPNSADDNPYLVGSPERLMRASGWAPRIALGESLRDVLSETFPLEPACDPEP